MERNIRRALYTGLVAGGLVLVGATSAHAAGDDLPVAGDQRAVAADATVGAAAPAGADAAARPAEAADAGQRARHDDGGLVGDLVDREGILGSLVVGDVAGVVDGALGEDGLVDDLLTGVPPTGGNEPDGVDPGVEEPGVGEPGVDGPEPGTAEPGTNDPGTNDPGTNDPGTNDPGTEAPGTDEPGTDEPGVDLPGLLPGTGLPGDDGVGPDRPGADHEPTPGRDPGAAGPEAGPRPAHGGTGGAGPSREARDDVVLASRTDEQPDGGFTSPSAPVADDRARTGASAATVPSSAAYPVAGGTTGPAADTAGDAPAERPRATPEPPAAGVDLRWGDDGDPKRAPKVYDGNFMPGDPSEGFLGAATEPTPEPENEAEPVVVPGAETVRTGHMFTGQLSLISLLLGLGIAALRTRRR